MQPSGRRTTIEAPANRSEADIPITGISLGTSNSAAAVLGGGRPVMIPGAEGITLGSGTLGVVAASLLARNTPIPIKRFEIFTTAAEMFAAFLKKAGQALYAQGPESEPHPRPDVGTPSGEPRPTDSGPGDRVVDAEHRDSAEPHS